MNSEYLFSALKQYDLQNKTATLAGHNETMAFNVADLFLLRIHKPADCFNSDFLYQNLSRKDIYLSELQLLEFLKQNGMDVQSPVTDKNGEYVSVIEDDIPITVLNWIKGKPAGEKDLTCEFCTRLGAEVAKLHRISKNFDAKNILKYDAELCDILKEQFNIAYSKGYFDFSHYSTLVSCCDVIKQAFDEYKDEFTVIHGDLSPSNTVITPYGLSLIDFSLFGYGHPVVDIACIFSYISEPHLRNCFINGYQSNGAAINSNMFNVCYAFNEIMGILLHIDKLATESWFESWLGRLCRDIFIPVIEKREILWTDSNV